MTLKRFILHTTYSLRTLFEETYAIVAAAITPPMDMMVMRRM